MTTLGEFIRGGCSEVGGDTNANMQRSGEIEGGVPVWMIVGWGAVTAIFVGMILHSRRRQTPNHSDDRINDPFPDDSKESDDEKPTSD